MGGGVRKYYLNLLKCKIGTNNKKQLAYERKSGIQGR